MLAAMVGEAVTRDQVLDAIRSVVATLGHTPSRSEFANHAGITQHWVIKHFGNWNEAVDAAGFEPNTYSKKIEPAELLADWGTIVRQLRRIPTRTQYERNGGRYSVATFDKAFRSWSRMPPLFREFAATATGWDDVLSLLPADPVQVPPQVREPEPTWTAGEVPHHNKLRDRPTYGNPIDFRGLRHEPVNEQGVVFLFGMVARELGYHVEAVQTGFPDCEAKRQIGDSGWQRVRIEFEYESRNFRDHGHAVDGCDVVVCWRHNWPDCPSSLEVLELRSVIRSLASADE